MKNRIVSFLTVIAVSLTVFLAGVFTPAEFAAAQEIDPEGKADPEVAAALQRGETSDFLIVMTDQADLSAAYTIDDWDERGWYVYNTLLETAERSQKGVIEQLERQGLQYRSFIAGNEIYVYGGTQAGLNAVLDLSEVGTVRAPVVVKLDPTASQLQPFRFNLPQTTIEAITTWGLTDSGAPAFWAAYGRQGQGIVVANIDTGVQYDHPALENAYRCYGANIADPKCWHDASGVFSQLPADTNGHGTHTMGTMIGSNNPSLAYSVGMAPAAQWIACDAFQGSTTGNAQLLACADWILAPGGNPADRPHIVNNSWGDEFHDTWFQSKVQAWTAAGIFPVFSAGNEGPTNSCSDLGSPADYPEGFTVAAHDSSRWIAYFSSKGGTTSYTKPNLSAPGVGVVSAYPGSSWNSLGGTSMAAPHVAGAAALLWSCNAGLLGDISFTSSLLQASAGLPPAGMCGKPQSGGGNFTYGYGFLDVFKAGQLGCAAAIHTVYVPTITRNASGGQNPVQNPGFEAGDVVWAESSSLGYDLILNNTQDLPLFPFAGSWMSWLGGDYDEISSLSQAITLPIDRPILSFWFYSQSTTTCNQNYFKVWAGNNIKHSETLCVANDKVGWVRKTVDLSPFAGTLQVIKFEVSNTADSYSNVFLDDISMESALSIAVNEEQPAGIEAESMLPINSWQRTR